MNKLYLLDAYALIYRAFYALMNAQRVNSKGFNTSTVFGFVNTLTELLDKGHPTHIAVAFDPKGPTFRHKAYPAYKAQREKQPEGITESVPIIKDIIRAFNIPIFEVQGYEADDVIGTLALQAEQQGLETYMVTPDKDYCQLASDKVKVYRPSHGKTEAEILDSTGVNQKYGLNSPVQVIDMLGLMGDTADNVPGCPGVGPKTAVTLIQKYGSIEGIYQHLDQLKGKLKQNLETNKEQVEFSKYLVTIKRDVPVTLDLEQVKRKDINRDQLKQIFDQLEFKSLLRKYKLDTPTSLSTSSQPGAAPIASASTRASDMSGMGDLFAQPSAEGTSSTAPSSATDPKISAKFPTGTPDKPEKSNLSVSEVPPTKIQIAETKEQRAEIIQKISEQKIVSLEFATTSQAAVDAELVGLALSTAPGEAWYVPVESGMLFGEDTIAEFSPIFEDETVTKVAYNIKYLMRVLLNYHISLRGPIFDVMIAHYVLQPEQRHYLSTLASSYLQADAITLEDTFGPKWRDKRNMEALPRQTAAAYCCQVADYCLRLKPLLTSDLNDNGEYQLYDQIELPLTKVLAHMEDNGVLIDTNVLSDISLLFTSRLNEYQSKVYEITGEQFNLSSPRQVGEVLFDKMKLDDKAKRTKTGQYDTSEAVLETLKHKSPVIDYLLSYRGMKKLLSTYVDALPALINKRTGHIHTSFNQAVTATGRLSSSDPNLQNIPVRGEDGKEIRKAFIPEPGCLFFSADYSQIELRIMAHLSQDSHMIAAFRDGLDIHAATAAKVFHKDIADVTADERRKAKTANFGIIYGITSFGLSQRIGVSRSEAKELIDNYFATFPSIRQYTENIIQRAREQGFVETLFHRRRYLSDINSRNGQVRKFAERNAVNAPIQGSAADIIKIAMIRIARRFDEESLRSKMILQVHDELNFSVYPEEREAVEQIVSYEMAHACELSVPLLADCGWGANWLEAH